VTYFGYHARAEPVRVALELAGVKWVDNVADYMEFTSKYKGETPHGYLPVLEENGVGEMKDQGKALMRYICQKHGMLPEDKMARYKCE